METQNDVTMQLTLLTFIIIIIIIIVIVN